MTARGIVPGQWLDLVSYFEGQRRRAPRFKAVPYEVPRGCAVAYYPETNVLVAVGNVSEGSNQPASKSIVISLEPAAPT